MSSSTTGTGVSSSSMRKARSFHKGPSRGQQRDAIDLDQDAAHLATDCGADRRLGGEELFIYSVVLLEAAAIGQVAIDLDHILHVASDAAKNGLDILESLPHLIGKLIRQDIGR